LSYCKLEKKPGLCLVTFQKPETLNALDSRALAELEEIRIQLENDPTMRVVIFSGAGKAFIAGADISEMQKKNPSEATAFSREGQRVFRNWELSSLVSIAAIHGFSLGGGLEFALSMDIRLATPEAKLGLPEVGLGLLPGFGGTQRLSRWIGVGPASELIFTARKISGE